MNFGQTDEDELRDKLRQSPEDVESLVSEETRSLRREQFLGDPVTIALIIAFLKAVAGVGSAIGTVKVLLEKGKALFSWARQRFTDNIVAIDATPSEQILALIYFAYNKNKSGIELANLITLSGLDEDVVVASLSRLEALGFVRKTKTGEWKFNH
jgi:hypothetical protein